MLRLCTITNYLESLAVSSQKKLLSARANLAVRSFPEPRQWLLCRAQFARPSWYRFAGGEPVKVRKTYRSQQVPWQDLSLWGGAGKG